jgi:NAD(P)-dependent dehydrogenase (short-subunit alcohol dehydrogenase family)
MSLPGPRGGQLAGQVAVITGGSEGIGLAIAQRFAAEGAYVYISGRRAAALAAAAQLIGSGQVTTVQGDAARPDDLDRLYATVAADGRTIDVLVANAGGGGGAGPVGDVTEEQFDAGSGLTFRGTFFTVQRAVPLLADGAAIVLISSIAGSNGSAGHSVYNASKAAVRSLARTFTNDLKDRHIRVNALSPGPIETDGFARFAGDRIEELRAELARELPVGHLGRPAEVASAALFLASSQSSFVAGVELVVDGGLSQV